MRNSSNLGFNTFLFRNNDNGMIIVKWTVSSINGKGNGRTGKSGDSGNTDGTYDNLQSTRNNNGKAMTILLRYCEFFGIISSSLHSPRTLGSFLYSHCPI